MVEKYSSGFTLIEALVGSFAATLTMLTVMRLISASASFGLAMNEEFAIRQEMSSLRKLLSSTLDRRYTPNPLATPPEPASVEFINSAGFQPSAAGSCQDLIVRVREPFVAGTFQLISIVFTTRCGGNLEGSGSLIHPNTSCVSPARSEVIVTHYLTTDEIAGNLTNPLSQTTFPLSRGALAVCFIQDPVRLGTFHARISGLFHQEDHLRRIDDFLSLDLTSQPPNLEILPN